MTGPPYPRRSGQLGSSAIGEFAIGISPIGIGITPVGSPFDIWSTVINQYANSPILTSLILSFNAAVDQSANMDQFYDMIWDVAIAQGYGLDVWGRIVGVERTLTLPSGAQYLGFQEAGSSWTGFGQGGFYSGGGTTPNLVLSDADYRILILAKAAGNISDGSIPALNAILLALFPARGDCYVADNQDMSLTYTFPFGLTPVELAILQQSGVLPNPAGVVVNITSP